MIKLRGIPFAHWHAEDLGDPDRDAGRLTLVFSSKIHGFSMMGFLKWQTGNVCGIGQWPRPGDHHVLRSLHENYLSFLSGKDECGDEERPVKFPVVRHFTGSSLKKHLWSQASDDLHSAHRSFTSWNWPFGWPAGGAPGRWVAGAAGVDDFNVCQEMHRRHWGWWDHAVRPVLFFWFSASSPRHRHVCTPIASGMIWTTRYFKLNFKQDPYTLYPLYRINFIYR